MGRLKQASLFVLSAAVLVLLVWQMLGPGTNLAVAAATPGKSYAGSSPAPEFPAGLDWINTGGEPLTLADLKGKVVVLDFWTFGCINCMHVIPDLKRLQAKYPKGLAVIGVHSAKFRNEGRTSQIRKVAQRYERTEPIVNDHDMQVWRAWHVNAWPTIAVVDPAGNAVGTVSGEGHYELLDQVVGSLITEARAAGKLDERPLGFTPDPVPKGPLLFPGKVLADSAGGRLFISDSNHDRIVVTDLAGRVTRVIGGHGRGLNDGDLAHATFHQPQGLTLADHDTLYVADNLDGAIRRVDLAAGKVVTVAGTGEQTYMRGDDLDARITPLNSPWAVLWHDGGLIVAMAGQHQLWRYDPTDHHIRRWAGTGYEALEDGPRLSGSMAQPSGLATDGAYLYVADAEASAVRRVVFGRDGALDTLVGAGLFDFGDQDGVGGAVRLQHALGVSCAGGKVYVADTYNSALKELDPAKRSVRTLVRGFDEPGGLSVAAGKVYVADTNHHAIKVYDLASGALSTLTLADPDHLL